VCVCWCVFGGGCGWGVLGEGELEGAMLWKLQVGVNCGCIAGHVIVCIRVSLNACFYC